MILHRKKLIEVALPLDEINAAGAKEKSVRHGHPSTLHLWWSRKPLAVARAVIFAQMVDDPSEYVDALLSSPGIKQAAQIILKERRRASNDSSSQKNISDESALNEIVTEQERKRLFKILEELVLWKNTTNERVLDQARNEIWQSWKRECAVNANHPQADELYRPDRLPVFHDPFAGGGSLPLEAQRLGLEAHASDLNPVAVLINKAMIEVPPKFAGHEPVNPDSRYQSINKVKMWRGAQGLAEDIRYYGQWMKNEAKKRIGNYYPTVEITSDMTQERPDLKPYVGKNLTVIAWLWARTVKSPNPAFADVDVPLTSTFMLSTKKGKEAYVVPVVNHHNYKFRVVVGPPQDAKAVKLGTKLARGANFRCVMSGSPISPDYIKAESIAGRMNSTLMAVVVEGNRGRVYLPPTCSDVEIAFLAQPRWKPEETMNRDTTNLVSGRGYGFFKWADLFSSRQLVALTTFCDLVQEVKKNVLSDSATVRISNDKRSLQEGGSGAIAYAEAVSLYLGITVSRLANRHAFLSFWDPMGQKVQQVFARQALPMVWDPCEANPFSNSSGNWLGQLLFPIKFLLSTPISTKGDAIQNNAVQGWLPPGHIVSTDPPYYDNIGYADLSDFFYVWLRRSLRSVFPELFATMTVPKIEELVATPYRHGNKKAAEKYFLNGMTKVFQRIVKQTHPGFPVTIYYAYKQSETKVDSGTASTGWETFLSALIDSGFAITGTWPMRTELTGNLKKNIASLASSIVLICRIRSTDISSTNRREFLTALRSELPQALRLLQSGNIAPVDLTQAAIGPGMAVYTRYEKVLDADGTSMTVREALSSINQILDEVLAEQEGDLDADSRWALVWFDQHGFEPGNFGSAETLSKAQNTSVEGLVEAGILESKRGAVRLLKPDELSKDWSPENDKRSSVWEVVHHLIFALDTEGEQGASELIQKLGGEVGKVKDLCYRLYTLCERKKRAAEALSYNSLVQSWPEISRLAKNKKPEDPELNLD